MKKINTFIFVFAIVLCLGVNSSNLMAANSMVKPKTQVKKVVTPAKKTVSAKKPVTTPVKATPQTYNYISVKSLDLVKNPNYYLNKRVKIIAKFDKFSSLGLDYKPAFKPSEKYISFLIRRDDSSNDIPLSELKNFMKRELAEKYIDLETDDVIEYSGLVFSNALGDVWLDVENFKIVSAKSKNTDSAKK